jgi:hypothetical protein
MVPDRRICRPLPRPEHRVRGSHYGLSPELGWQSILAASYGVDARIAGGSRRLSIWGFLDPVTTYAK